MLALNQLTLYWRAGQSKFQIIVVVKTFNIKSTLKILGTQHSTVKNRYTVAQQISGIYSSWMIETLHLLNSNSPFSIFHVKCSYILRVLIRRKGEIEFSYFFKFVYMTWWTFIKLMIIISWCKYVSQIIMLYTWNMYNAICQLYFNKTGRWKEKKTKNS